MMSRVLDPLFRYRVGKSALGIWQEARGMPRVNRVRIVHLIRSGWTVIKVVVSEPQTLFELELRPKLVVPSVFLLGRRTL